MTALHAGSLRRRDREPAGSYRAGSTEAEYRNPPSRLVMMGAGWLVLIAALAVAALGLAPRFTGGGFLVAAGALIAVAIAVTLPEPVLCALPQAADSPGRVDVRSRIRRSLLGSAPWWRPSSSLTRLVAADHEGVRRLAELDAAVASSRIGGAAVANRR